MKMGEGKLLEAYDKAVFTYLNDFNLGDHQVRTHFGRSPLVESPKVWLRRKGIVPGVYWTLEYMVVLRAEEKEMNVLLEHLMSKFVGTEAKVATTDEDSFLGTINLKIRGPHQKEAIGLDEDGCHYYFILSVDIER